jgi:hypothetical protein
MGGGAFDLASNPRATGGLLLQEGLMAWLEHFHTIPIDADYAGPEMAASRIRELRLEKAEVAPRAFTVAALAQRLGVDPGTLRSWERGTHRPTQRHLRQLARELGVSVDELAQQTES